MPASVGFHPNSRLVRVNSDPLNAHGARTLCLLHCMTPLMAPNGYAGAG
jgi:hypothetical protein